MSVSSCLASARTAIRSQISEKNHAIEVGLVHAVDGRGQAMDRHRIHGPSLAHEHERVLFARLAAEQRGGRGFEAEAYLPDIADGEVRGFHVLVHDVTEITENRKRLAQSLKEREVMLQEIHHRVKNNLQIVSSLLNLQLRRIGQGAARDALEGCQRRVMTIALIHEQLYQTTDFSQVHFGQYLRNLVSNVFRTAATSTNVRLDIQVDGSVFRLTFRD